MHNLDLHILEDSSGIPFNDFGIIDFGIIISLGRSKEAERTAIAPDFGATFEGSSITGFGEGFLTAGGGVDRFLAFGFSKLAASALKAGDLPLTRTRSGLKDMLLER